MYVAKLLFQKFKTFERIMNKAVNKWLVVPCCLTKHCIGKNREEVESTRSGSTCPNYSIGIS